MKRISVYIGNYKDMKRLIFLGELDSHKKWICVSKLSDILGLRDIDEIEIGYKAHEMREYLDIIHYLKSLDMDFKY